MIKFLFSFATLKCYFSPLVILQRRQELKSYLRQVVRAYNQLNYLVILISTMNNLILIQMLYIQQKNIIECVRRMGSFLFLIIITVILHSQENESGSKSGCLSKEVTCYNWSAVLPLGCP